MAEVKTRVVCLRRSKGVVVQSCDVYIGRAISMGGWNLPCSKWHNPFVVGPDGTVQEVIAKYEAYLQKRPDLIKALPELRGKTLGCWCKKPKTPNAPCHGDVLVRLLQK
jgi:hypothetical protein